MGVDCGITNVAYTSTGLSFCGAAISEFKKKRQRVRASLQSKGTRGCRTVLRRLSGYEKRFTRHQNHVFSKRIVEESKRHDCGVIRQEQLKDIRTKTRTWNKHRNRMVANWSYYQLQQYVSYKAAEAGITVELINPAYTSQTCHKCYKLGSRKGDLFTCLTCGEMHADYNAACMISSGGAALNAPELATSVSQKSPGFSHGDV